MDLIAVSYKNIWPFKDRLISIFFDDWKYLVKSPIGTWKSFLFFDGPMYGLYKYSSRNMLNIASKEWFIKLLWDFEWEKFLLVRKLIKWKSKDSCQSGLFKIDGLDVTKFGMEFNEKIINEDVDVQEILQHDKTITIEEIKFKNETDLQLHLTSFLEPREVFLSTVFLMQDNDNIFEMVPADRLNVLKNVFGLIGIDEAKEKIMEKKREIIAQIKANEDNSKYDLKLRSLIEEYLEWFEELTKFWNKRIDIDDHKEFFNDMKMIKEKINANEFEIWNFPIELNQILDDKIDILKNEYNKILNQKENLIKNKEEIQSQERLLNKEKIELTNNSKIFEEKIKSLDESKVNELKKKKIIQQASMDVINQWVKNKEIDLKWLKNEWIEIWDDANIGDYYNLIQDLVSKWSLYKVQKDWLDAEIKNTKILREKEIDRINNEIKNLEDKKNMRDEEMEKLDASIEIFKKNMQEQEIFECEKIWTHCPFIKVINKKTFDNLQEQKDKLYIEKTILTKKIKDENIEAKIKDLKYKMQELEKENNSSDDILREIKVIQDKIDWIKDFLNQIDYKKIWEIYKEYQDLDKNLKTIDREISNLEAEFGKLQEYKIEVEKNKVRIENIEEKLEIANNQLGAESEKLQQIENQISRSNYEDVKKIEKINIQIKENIRDIGSLIEEFKNSKIHIKKLQEEEKILNNLYHIFSRELLLVVLQDSLPILNDIINSFLSQVVDYQINFDLNKSNSEKLELDIKILDDKWARDVKSLSGWQRIILKLVRMLAISSYIRSSILFLDETINNLDADTVWKVADMLEDFVKSRNMKFFVVTHSQQIQDMDIRDKTINI